MKTRYKILIFILILISFFISLFIMFVVSDKEYENSSSDVQSCSLEINDFFIYSLDDLTFIASVDNKDYYTITAPYVSTHIFELAIRPNTAFIIRFVYNDTTLFLEYQSNDNNILISLYTNSSLLGSYVFNNINFVNDLLEVDITQTFVNIFINLNSFRAFYNFELSNSIDIALSGYIVGGELVATPYNNLISITDDEFNQIYSSIPTTTQYYDIAYNNGYGVGRENGYAIGFNDGLVDGQEIGFDIGYNSGWAGGYTAGYDNGYLEGTDYGYSQKGLFYNLIDSISSIFEIRIGGNYGLTIGGLLLIGISIVSFFVLVKILK